MQEKIGEFELNKVYCGDCLELLPKLPDNSVDLVVTDPPYFNIMKSDWKGKKYQFDRFENLRDFLNLLEDTFIQIRRIVKNNGSVYVFADDINVSFVHLKIGKILSKKGFILLNHLVWYKQNSMTNKGVGYFKFAPNTERILFFGSPASIEYDIVLFSPIREYLRRIKKLIRWKSGELNKFIGQSSMPERHWFVRSQWCMPTKESYEKFDRFCYIKTENNEDLRREYEDLRREYEDLRREYEDLRRPFNTNIAISDVIVTNITSSYEKGVHPTQKPLFLIRKLIKISSKEGDIVLDPFIGSGTTAVACKQLGRDFIGFEINPDYVKIANRRLSQQNINQFVELKEKEKEKCRRKK